MNSKSMWQLIASLLLSSANLFGFTVQCMDARNICTTAIHMAKPRDISLLVALEDESSSDFFSEDHGVKTWNSTWLHLHRYDCSTETADTAALRLFFFWDDTVRVC